LRIHRHQAAALLLTACLSGGAVVAADALDAAIGTSVSAQAAAVKSQRHIDKLADETASLLDRYRDALRQTGSLRRYDDQLEKLVNGQDQEIASFGRRMTNARTVRQRLVPLMLRMVDVLGRLVALDVPFLKQERSRRLAALRQLMDDPDASLSEKYRRVMEAYQVEAEYGRTIEAYTGELDRGGHGRTVDFLRIGRVALLYLSFDRRHGGYWDRHTRHWRDLPPEYLDAVTQGIRIARKQAPPELIRLPVPAPERAPQHDKAPVDSGVDGPKRAGSADGGHPAPEPAS
jgi:hypothetical protein